MAVHLELTKAVGTLSGAYLHVGVLVVERAAVDGHGDGSAGLAARRAVLAGASLDLRRQAPAIRLHAAVVFLDVRAHLLVLLASLALSLASGLVSHAAATTGLGHGDSQ